MIRPERELVTHIVDTLAAIAEPMGLDRWNLTAQAGPLEDARACAEVAPEYREGVLSFDLDKLKTNDDVAELVVHEATHAHTGALHDIGLELADALADSLPENFQAPVRRLLRRRVNYAAEQVTTDVGHTYLRLLRRAGVLDTPPTNS